MMSENLCEDPHIFTEQGLIGFKSALDASATYTARQNPQPVTEPGDLHLNANDQNCVYIGLKKQPVKDNAGQHPQENVCRWRAQGH